MNRFVIAVLFLASHLFSHAQWSVLNTDPRIKDNKTPGPLWQPFTIQEWNASNFAPKKDVNHFLDLRYGMFLCYGLSSYVNRELGWPIVINHKLPDPGRGSYPDSAWQVTWPSQWKMDKFNADDLVKIARQAQMKYIVIIVKHHDGFHMWDTKYSNFKITNTPFRRDYFKELVDACHKANMPIGIYYSQRDWYHPDYAPVDSTIATRTNTPPFFKVLPNETFRMGPTHKKYIEYQYNVIRELLTNYGKIDLFWFDAAWYSGMFTAEMWDAENLTRMMRKLQPHIVINNRASVPGDFDTPEQRIGMYQTRAWESAMTLNGVWSFDPKPPVKPTNKLIREMLTAAAGNGNVLLSWGAKFDGTFDPAQKDTLLKVGNWLKKYGKAYYGTRGGPWMPNRDYGAVHKNNKMYLYVFNWKPEGIYLPVLQNNNLKAVNFLNVKGKVNWTTNLHTIHIVKPNNPNDIVAIVELVFEQPVNQIFSDSKISIFDDPAFGKKLITKQIHTDEWNKNEYTLDLGILKSISGVRVERNSKTATVFVSIDSTDWQKIGETVGDLSEIPLTTYVSGAYLPGKLIRFIQLKSPSPIELKLDVYGID